MIEEFEYKGVWWLPDKPEEQISGTLKFTPHEGAVLDLIGSLKEVQEINKTLWAGKIILGKSSDGKDITLNDCFETNMSLSFPSLLTSSYYANKIFIGAHFQKEEDIKFKKLYIHYSNLDDWTNISGFDLEIFDKNKVVIKYHLPEPILAANISGCYDIFVDIRATFPVVSILKEASIRQKTYIRIETVEEKSFEEYLTIAYNIRNFLALAIMQPVYPLSIEGITEINKTTTKEGKTYNPPVYIYYSISNISIKSKLLMPFDMLFTLGDIKDQLGIFLANWFSKSELLKPVYDLYFSTFYNPTMYLENRFLSLEQAIESYHRRVYGGKYQADDQYQSGLYIDFIKSIPDEIDEDFKESLKGKFRYLHEYSLRKRLKELLNEEPFSELTIFNEKNKNYFIDKIVNTRNYLTHYDETLKEQAADENELYRLTLTLKLLLEICLLKEIGFTSEIIKRIVSKSRTYREISNVEYFS